MAEHGFSYESIGRDGPRTQGGVTADPVIDEEGIERRRSDHQR
jgi:hypothetical protein